MSSRQQLQQEQPCSHGKLGLCRFIDSRGLGCRFGDKCRFCHTCRRVTTFSRIQEALAKGRKVSSTVVVAAPCEHPGASDTVSAMRRGGGFLSVLGTCPELVITGPLGAALPLEEILALVQIHPVAASLLLSSAAVLLWRLQLQRLCSPRGLVMAPELIAELAIRELHRTVRAFGAMMFKSTWCLATKQDLLESLEAIEAAREDSPQGSCLFAFTCNFGQEEEEEDDPREMLRRMQEQVVRNARRMTEAALEAATAAREEELARATELATDLAEAMSGVVAMAHEVDVAGLREAAGEAAAVAVAAELVEAEAAQLRAQAGDGAAGSDQEAARSRSPASDAASPAAGSTTGPHQANVAPGMVPAESGRPEEEAADDDTRAAARQEAAAVAACTGQDEATAGGHAAEEEGDDSADDVFRVDATGHDVPWLSTPPPGPSDENDMVPALAQVPIGDFAAGPEAFEPWWLDTASAAAPATPDPAEGAREEGMPVGDFWAEVPPTPPDPGAAGESAAAPAVGAADAAADADAGGFGTYQPPGGFGTYQPPIGLDVEGADWEDYDDEWDEEDYEEQEAMTDRDADVAAAMGVPLAEMPQLASQLVLPSEDGDPIRLPCGASFRVVPVILGRREWLDPSGRRRSRPQERICSLKPMILGMRDFESSPGARAARYDARLWSASPRICSMDGLGLYEEQDLSRAEVHRLLGHSGITSQGSEEPPLAATPLRVVAVVRCMQRFWDLKLL